MRVVNEAVAYWLLFLDLAVGAAVIGRAICCALWLVRRIRRWLRHANAEQGTGQVPDAVRRRYDSCGYGWWAPPGTELDQRNASSPLGTTLPAPARVVVRSAGLEPLPELLIVTGPRLPNQDPSSSRAERAGKRHSLGR
jgi:hypothetical protein